jgi:septum formation protein
MEFKLNQTLSKRKLILASSSPRRAQILKKENIEFKVVPPKDIQEKDISSDPVEHVLELSRRKAKSVIKKVKEGLILGADTIVVLDGEILGKPIDEKDAQRILKKLSGKTHRVYTGLTLMNRSNGKILSGYDCTEVRFNKLEEKEIMNYIETGEPMDKAGAYGIQGMGSFLVDHIKGNLDNVIGLPMKKFEGILKKITQDI